MTDRLDPVENAIAEARLALSANGWTNITIEQRELIIAYWQGMKLDSVRDSLKQFTTVCPLFSGGAATSNGHTKRVVLELAIPYTVTGASVTGLVAVLLKLLGAI